MDFCEGEKATGEILRSLLTVKMENSMKNDVNNWKQSEQKFQSGNIPLEEQIVWQIESNGADKHEFISNNQNVIQQIPINYLSTNERNSTFGNVRTILKPFTCVLTRNVIDKVANYCGIDRNSESIMSNESEKIVLQQEINSNTVKNDLQCNEGEETSYKMPENLFEIEIEKRDCTNKANSIIENAGNSGSGECIRKSDRKWIRRKTKKNMPDSESILAKSKALESARTKLNIKKKISAGRKKPSKKRKNSKLKSKLKSVGKSLSKTKTSSKSKPAKTVESNPKDEEDGGEEFSGRNPFELTDLEDEVDQVAERLKIGCDCSDANCFDGLNPDKVYRHRLNIADLTKAEHDMYLMGVIMASMQNLEQTCRHKKRMRIRSCYAYQGKKVCLTAFLYLQHVTLYQMKMLRSHLKNHGVSPRIHGNRRRKPANTFSLDIYHSATDFVQNYIERHCVKSVPNFTTFSYGGKPAGNPIISAGSNATVKSNRFKIPNKINSYHLPSECTKKIVHNEYKSHCENSRPSQKAMKYSTFTNFLQKQFPNVKFHKVEKKQMEKTGCRFSETVNGLGDRENSAGKVDVEEPETVSADKCVQTPGFVRVSAETSRIPETGNVGVVSSNEVSFQVRVGRTETISQAVKMPQALLAGKSVRQFLAVGNGNGCGIEPEVGLTFPNRMLIGYPAIRSQSQIAADN